VTTPQERHARLEAYRSRVEASLAAHLPPAGEIPERLHAAMRYSTLGGGKRVRPALVYATGELLGVDPAALDAAAAAVEMIHVYSLIHDDLPAMDDDDERRGRPTVHIVFGEAIAILAGDGLLTAAFGTLAELGPHAALAIAVLARRAGVAELLGGQAIDLGMQRGGEAAVTIAALERLHAGKTGALFAASAELGAIAAGAPAATCAALGRWGMAIGIAFQHADDRDDAEFAELADAAAARMRVLCTEAREIARSLGPGGETLEAIAAWIAASA
jgi:geranylgeranyl pyrophosphate synthase